MSEGVDAKQFGFSLVGLALGACVLFVAGLQLGQNFDLFGGLGADKPSVEAPRETVIGQRTPPRGTQAGEFSFFSDLKEPDRGPKQRRMPVPDGNANDRQPPSPAGARKVLARGGARKTRTLKRKVRKPAAKATKAVAARAKLAPPTLVGREPAKAAEGGAPVGRRIVRDSARKPPVAVGQRSKESAPGRKKFTVQAGSFGEYGDAFTLAQRLRGRDLKAHVVLINKPGQDRTYKVRMGGFANRDAASKALQKVQSEGVSASIVSP